MWVVGGYFVLYQKNSLGEIVAFTQLISNISVPLYSATSLVTSFLSGKATLEEVDHEINVEDSNKYAQLISMQNINYNDFVPVSNPNLLINLQFNISKKYLIVGESGSGKSSLLYPILKLTNPASNTVFIDNQDINDISPHAIYKNWIYFPV